MNHQKEISSPPKGSILSDIREAVMGTTQDFTEGNIGRAILLLSIPMVLEMVMESIFGIVDIFFVARLGADHVAAVGLTESMIYIIFAVAVGLSVATSAMVSRRIGEKKPAEASRVAVQAIFLGILISIPVSVIGIMQAPNLLRMMGASAETIDVGKGYCAVIIGGNVIIMLLFLLNAVFRGAGDAAIAMRVLWVANGINILLDPCFIFGLGPFPELGVTGAAVATTIGRGIGVLFQLYILFRGRGRISIALSQVRIHLATLMTLLRVSLGGIFQYFVATSSWMILVRIIAIFGSSALAGYTVGIRIIVIAILPAWGMSNAAATLVGQNLGANKPERAEHAVWRTGLFAMIFLGLIALFFIIFAENLIRFFTTDPAVIPYGVNCLRYLSYGNFFYAYGMVMVQAFNGAGDTYTPTWIYFFTYWFFQIPISYLLAIQVGLGADGVFMGILMSESLTAVVGILLFKRGKWKDQKL